MEHFINKVAWEESHEHKPNIATLGTTLAPRIDDVAGVSKDRSFEAARSHAKDYCVVEWLQHAKVRSVADKGLLYVLTEEDFRFA